MNILWLYRYTPHRHYNHWFHTDFARAISEHEDINLKIYGYRMHETPALKDLILKPYNSNILLTDIKKEFDFDMIALDCWNRAYQFQGRYKELHIEDMWIPKDYININIPKVVIEGDYHNIRNSQWYSKLNIDLIMHRHLNNTIKANKELDIKNVWLPCSIDNKIFKPDNSIIRENIVCAVGEMTNPVYEYRIEAMNKLRRNNYLYRSSLIREEKYVKCLQSYTSHLNGSSVFDLNIAKMFEIMSSGSVLFTDEVIGIERLFPSNSYCSYKRDYSNLISRARKIINDSDYRTNLTNNALKCIAERHTHKVRVKEFIDIIKKEFKI